jgi:hypothetical protein
MYNSNPQLKGMPRSPAFVRHLSKDWGRCRGLKILGLTPLYPVIFARVGTEQEQILSGSKFVYTEEGLISISEIRMAERGDLVSLSEIRQRSEEVRLARGSTVFPDTKESWVGVDGYEPRKFTVCA